MERGRKQVAGSHRTPLHNARAVGEVDANRRIEVTVRLRSRSPDADWEAFLREMNSQPPSERSYLSREELAARRGASPEDLAKIDAFAHANHLTVVESSIPKRTVRLSGTYADLRRAFGAKLQIYKAKDITYRGRTGHIYVPGELAGLVEGVFGLDNRPVGHHPHSRAAGGPAEREPSRSGEASKSGKVHKLSAPTAAATRKASTRFTVREVARQYRFPDHLDGTGQSIALIELNSIDPHGSITGTGYTVADLRAFAKKSGRTMPRVTAIGVQGGANTPGQYPSGDGEVTMDIGVANAVAPGARIAVYFAPNTDAGFIDAVNTALHDTLRKPSIISISWGSPEDGATDQFLEALNQILLDAAAIGVTVCCEVGDYGSSDEPAESRDGQPHVEFPASSPYALACGGTVLVRSGAKIGSEVVWNEGDGGGSGGGGVSNKFHRPWYQSSTTIPSSPQGTKGRGLPDVAANAVGYRAIVGGKEIPADGTSIVAPLWSGLIALINQGLIAAGGKPVGFLNPLIYGPQGSNGAFHDVVEGNNDIDGKLKNYSAGPGWDACTGIGTPDGEKLLQWLQGRSKAKIKGHRDK